MKNKLDELIKFGYPRHILGSRLKKIDDQLETVANGYAKIHDSIVKLSNQLSIIQNRQTEIPEIVRKVVREEFREEMGAMQNRLLIGTGALILGAFGCLISAASQQFILDFIISNGTVIGGASVITATIILLTRPK